MNIDPAITEALEATLAEASDQSGEFKKRFRTLVSLILTSNYKDADVRRVMESLSVQVGSED
jgi:endonuclease III